MSPLQNSGRVRFFYVFIPSLPPVDWKFKERGVGGVLPSVTHVKVIAIVWRKELHCLSMCCVDTGCFLDVQTICNCTPYYVNSTLRFRFITFVVICRAALIKCSTHVFVDLDILMYTPPTLQHMFNSEQSDRSLFLLFDYLFISTFDVNLFLS